MRGVTDMDWETIWANIRAFFIVLGTILSTMVTTCDDIVRAVSNWTYSLGWVLPCWDFIANAGGVCR